MTTRRKVTIILASVIFMVLLSAAALDIIISNKISSLLNEHLVQSKTETDYLFKTNGGQIESYVYENSFWDDFYKATKEKDTTWISENMTSSLQHTNYGAEFMMVTDDKSNTFYSASIENKYDIKALNTIPLSFADSLLTKKFLHCIVPINNEFVEVFTAPVQASLDIKRTSKYAAVD
jgi:sensor domain CHASE-containing protein